MSARPRGGCAPAPTALHRPSACYRGDDTTPLDRLVACAARALLPSPLSEQAWLRRRHEDLPALETWELRRELRILTSFVDSPAGQRSWDRPWFEERLQRLRAELARRAKGGAR